MLSRWGWVGALFSAIIVVAVGLSILVVAVSVISGGMNLLFFEPIRETYGNLAVGIVAVAMVTVVWLMIVLFPKIDKRMKRKMEKYIEREKNGT